MPHFLYSFFDRSPDDGLIFHMCMGSTGILYLKKSHFLASFSITDNTDFFSDSKSVESCLFLYLSFGSFFGAFTDFPASFWEHQSSLMMSYTEHFFLSVTLSSDDCTSAGLEPKKRGHPTFQFIPLSERGIFIRHILIL